MPSRADVSYATTPEVGGRVQLIGVDATRPDLGLQRWRKRGAGNRRALERGRIALRCSRRIEQDLQEIRRAGVGRRSQVLDQVELLLGVAGSGRDHRATDRARAPVEDEAAGRQVVREGVEDHVASAHPGGIEPARRAPRILVATFGLVDRTGRREEAPEPIDRIRDETAKGRRRLLPRRQFRLSQHRQACQRGSGRDVAPVRLRRDAGATRAP